MGERLLDLKNQNKTKNGSYLKDQFHSFYF